MVYVVCLFVFFLLRIKMRSDDFQSSKDCHSIEKHSSAITVTALCLISLPVSVVHHHISVKHEMDTVFLKSLKKKIWITKLDRLLTCNLSVLESGQHPPYFMEPAVQKYTGQTLFKKITPSTF